MAITDNWSYAKREMTGLFGLLMAKALHLLLGDFNP